MQDFEYAVREFRKNPAQFLPTSSLASSTVSEDDNIKVCVRKRPQFPREIKAGEFDVVTALGPRHLAVSDGRMEADMVPRVLCFVFCVLLMSSGVIIRRCTCL